MKKYKTPIQIIAGILISVLSLYFAFRGIDFRESIEIIKNVKVKYVIISLVSGVLIISIRALRWECFIPLKQKIRKSTLIASVYVGYMANNILPAKLGEVVRAYILGAKENVSKTAIFASVVTERLFDVITGVVMLSIALIFIPNLPKTILYGAVFLFAISLVGICILVFMSVKRDISFSILNKILSIFPKKFSSKVNELAHNFIDGIGFKRDPWHIFLIFFYTVTYWSGQVFTVSVLLKAFNIEANAAVALFVIAASGFGFAVPSAPSGIGPIEWTIIFALTLVGVSRSVAAPYALVYHMLGIFPIIIIGFISLLYLGVDLKVAAKSGSATSTVGLENGD